MLHDASQNGSAQTPPDGRFDDAAVKVYHAAHDRLYSVIALLDGTTGSIVERVRYNAYGLARQQQPGDVNGDGAVNFTDYNFLLSHYGGSIDDTMSDYNVHADIDADGVVGFADLSIHTSAPTPPADGRISADSVRNTVGYAGYIHDPAAGPDGGMNLARHRWMDPALGRWITRDPLGYLDGANRLSYVTSNPIGAADPLGLQKCISGEAAFNRWGGPLARAARVRPRISAGVVEVTWNANYSVEGQVCKTDCGDRCDEGYAGELSFGWNASVNTVMVYGWAAPLGPVKAAAGVELQISGSASARGWVKVNECSRQIEGNILDFSGGGSIDIGGAAYARFAGFKAFEARLMGGGYFRCTSFYPKIDCCAGLRVWFETCFWNRCYRVTVFDINNCD